MAGRRSSVRDGEVESYDEPPPGPPIVVPERLEVDPSAVNGEDLIRGDDAEQADSYGITIASNGSSRSVCTIRPPRCAPSVQRRQVRAPGDTYGTVPATNGASSYGSPSATSTAVSTRNSLRQVDSTKKRMKIGAKHEWFAFAALVFVLAQMAEVIAPTPAAATSRAPWTIAGDSKSTVGG